MTDYGKPIQFWCLVCRRNRVFCQGATCWDHAIPVYAEIPEGERPEAKEPDEDGILVGGGVLAWYADVSAAVDGLHDKAVRSGAGVRWECWERGRASDGVLDGTALGAVYTLADAVLFVAEGRGPR